MKKLKLSPVFMLAVIFMAAIVPVMSGFEPMSFIASGAVVVLSSLLVEPANGIVVRKHAQAGEVGEDLKRVENEYKEVGAKLKQIGDDLKAQAEASQKELKKNAELSAETKANVDKLLTTQGELQARLQAAEQKIVDGSTSGGQEVVLSLGQQVVQSEAFQNFDPRNSKQFSVSAVITSTDASGGALIQPQRVAGIFAPPDRRMTVRDLIAPGRTQSNSIEYVRETGFTNNANVVSENPTNVKPESNIVFELDSAPVATIAHWIRASKQVLDDAAMLASYIDARLRYGLMLKEEQQLLKGSGVGLNINGIFTQATAYLNPGVIVQAQTRIDQIRLALLQAELAEYPADGIVLNPVDWAGIELTKDAQNAYLFANPHGVTTPSMWGRPVVATQAMDVSEFLVGAFKLAAQVWDREDATITISSEDRDNFVKNMVTILAEERVGLTVYRPEAFIAGEFEVASA